MKYLFTTICLTVFSFGFFGCLSHVQATDYHQAISSVLAQKERAGVSCARILIDSGDIVSVHLHGWDYLAIIKKIDVTGCPEQFRTAWSGYCAAWAQKLKEENAKEDTLDVISMWKGEIGDISATCHSLEAYDTAPAWQHCEQAAMRYGVKTTASSAR
jgi:hypothetical protein